MTSIAIIGLNGTLGAPLLKSLTTTFKDKVKFPIKAITRKLKEPSTDKVQYIEADLGDTEKVATALKGVDVIVELLSPTPELFEKLEKIAYLVKPKLFIPSAFGADVAEIQKFAPGFLAIKLAHSENIRKAGIKSIDIEVSLFTEPGSWSHEIVQHYGIDPETKTVTPIGPLSQKVSLTTFNDITNTISAVITDKDPSRFPNTIRVDSEKVTIQDIVDKYEQEHNVKLTIKKGRTAEQGLKDFNETLKNDGFDLYKFFFYLQATIAQEKATLFVENEKELVNPGQSLWKWGRF